jgi:diamine N-acetyltransferase
MINLRPITDPDFIQVESWPSYRPEFEYMDYALRQSGWLDEYRDKADTWIFIAEFNNQTIGFSLLSLTSKGDAEFRIAVHPDHTGMGFGPEVTMKTLQAGFCELNMERIHLIVRKNHFPAMKVYNRLGFKRVGESVHDIQGKPVEFYDMEIERESFDNLHGKETE